MPDTSAESLLLLAFAMGVGALLYGVLTSSIARLKRSWIAKRRARIAIQGEHNALALLHQHGYAVLATQCPMTWSIQVNGMAIPIELRADAIVERDGRRYVAEIKTGNEAPHIETAQTRRQLLEYLVAYQADGALLVNMPQYSIQEVQFAPQASAVPAPTRALRLVIWIALLTTILWFALR